jgi:hypothetical protein
LGNGNNSWLAAIGLLALATLALAGLIGGLILANNGHDVPPWLSGFIQGVGTNFGIVVLVLYRGGSNGNGYSQPPPPKGP